MSNDTKLYEDLLSYLKDNNRLLKQLVDLTDPGPEYDSGKLLTKAATPSPISDYPTSLSPNPSSVGFYDSIIIPDPPRDLLVMYDPDGAVNPLDPFIYVVTSKGKENELSAPERPIRVGQHFGFRKVHEIRIRSSVQGAQYEVTNHPHHMPFMQMISSVAPAAPIILPTGVVFTPTLPPAAPAIPVSVPPTPGTFSVTASFMKGPNTFTVPSGVATIYVTMWGGGASGGGAFSSLIGGGGGGGGSAAEILRSSMLVTPGQAISLSVGAGGLGVSAGSNGNDGGDTTFATLTAGGGKGGLVGQKSNGGKGGNGGIVQNLLGGQGGVGGTLSSNGGPGLQGAYAVILNATIRSGSGGGGGGSFTPTSGGIGANFISFTGGKGGIGMLSPVQLILGNRGGGGGGAAGYAGNGGDGNDNNAPSNSGAGGGGARSDNLTSGAGGDGGIVIEIRV